jgi:hypothetical protein
VPSGGERRRRAAGGRGGERGELALTSASYVALHRKCLHLHVSGWLKHWQPGWVSSMASHCVVTRWLPVCAQENPDENLLVAVGDALPILARALGPDAYAPIFAQQHADVLLKWTRASQPDAVRAAGVGEPPAWLARWPVHHRDT